MTKNLKKFRVGPSQAPPTGHQRRDITRPGSRLQALSHCGQDVPNMIDTEGPMSELTSLTPYIEVFDMVASVAFYRDILGFSIKFASPEVDTAEGRFSHFVMLHRGQAEIMLNTAYDSNERPPERRDGRWAACRHFHFYIDCDDVMGLYDEISKRGGTSAPPAKTGYGYFGFSLSDPDGYVVTFHQPA
jgi:uncharacterized glyoxalase superfamily protein PhnB